MSEPYPTDLYETCPCYWCQPKPVWRMTLCPTCGNKRCPAAADHTRWQCSGSNETGQVGIPLDPPVTASDARPPSDTGTRPVGCICAEVAEIVGNHLVDRQIIAICDLHTAALAGQGQL